MRNESLQQRSRQFIAFWPVGFSTFEFFGPIENSVLAAPSSHRQQLSFHAHGRKCQK